MAGDMLDQIQQRVAEAIATQDYSKVPDADLRAAGPVPTGRTFVVKDAIGDLHPVAEMALVQFDGGTVFVPATLDCRHLTANVDAIWSVCGRHALSGWVDADWVDGQVVIIQRDSGTELYRGDGSEPGIREEGEFPPRYTLFLDKAGYAQEAMAKGLITRREVEESYFGTPKSSLPKITRHMLENMSPGDVAQMAMRALHEVLLLKAEFDVAETLKSFARHEARQDETIAAMMQELRALRTEIAALKGTPPKPSDAEVLGRALGAHR